MKIQKGLLAIAAVGAGLTAQAQVKSLRGSDTLAGVFTDAIIAADMSDKLLYLGGGSGLGEVAIVSKQQGIAPMSREFTAEKLAAARAAGIEPKGHVLGLDGIGIFVNKAGNPLAAITFENIVKIFECKITDWTGVPGSGRTGAIKVYRRNDTSGTTDAFKSMTGLKTFGACVTALEHTAEVAAKTAAEANAVAYSGMTALRDGNKALNVAKDAASTAVAPTVATIRNFSYPLARKLWLYEATGSFVPTDAEKQFLALCQDRSFMDPIMQNNEFYTID